MFFPFPPAFLAPFPFFPPFCLLPASSAAIAASSLLLVVVLFRLVADSSAFDCWRFRLLALGLEAGTPALRLVARCSRALSNGGGGADMMVVEEKEVVTWHLGLRVYGSGFSRTSINRHKGKVPTYTGLCPRKFLILKQQTNTKK